MIPENRLSTTSVPGQFIDRVPVVPKPLESYEMGGVALNDPSQGLRVQLWTVRLVEGDVMLGAPGVPETVQFSAPALTEVDVAFDQNMQPFVAYMEGTVAKFWWYDPLTASMEFVTLPAGCLNVRCTLDDKRATQVGQNDIILAYMKNGDLCYRQQRDRFTIERVLFDNVGGQLVAVGMSAQNRLQFHIRDATHASVQPDAPYLADVVLDLCLRVGVTGDFLDVRQLYGDLVHGYGVDTDEGVDTVLEPLTRAYFFDPSEHSKKINFVKRGGSPCLRFTYRDLVEDSPQSMKQTRKDEVKLPRIVSVNHIDPDGAFAGNKQTARRRSNMVNAKSEENIKFDIVMPADQAMGVAAKILKMRWHEQMTYSFSLPIRFAQLVVTDVVEFLDKDGTIHRIRLQTRNENANIIKFTGPQDAGGATYQTNAVGLPLPPPPSSTPGIIGETFVEILNIAPKKDQDDELGVYVAACGGSSAWFGYDLLVSTDGGVNYFEALSWGVPATMGELVTALLPEVSSEYPSIQTVVVKSNFDLSSTTLSGLLNNANRCVIGDEECQFLTAEFLGDDEWELSGLVRGRYATAPVGHAAGTRFVLLDSAVVFVQIQEWMYGLDLMFKAVSYGTSEDDAVPTAYLFDEAVGQTEWPPTEVEATRDVSDNVTVDWIGRPRLGVESNPYPSKHFTGYRVKFSDGFSADVGPTTQTYTRASTPAAVTITVCGLNDLTGEGQLSAPITI